MATLTIADLDNGKRDLETIDAVANNTADSTQTRFGDNVLTLAGTLRRLGYQAPVAYVSGLTVDTGLFTVSKDGAIYAPRPEIVPFTTGAWDPSQWRVIQNTSNSNQLYQFSTLAAANAAAATLPEGSSVIVEGVSQGHIVAGAYVPTSGVPPETLDDYPDFATYSGKGSLFIIRDPKKFGIFSVIPGDSSTPSDGGTVFILADGRRVRRVGAGPLSPMWFGAKGDGVTNDTAARDLMSACMKTTNRAARYPAGTYLFSTPYVLDASEMHIFAEDNVTLKFTNVVTSSGLLIDGGASGSGIYRVRAKGLKVDAPSAANGVRIRGAHHLDIDVDVRGAVSNGMKTEWSVLSKIRIVVSVNEGAFSTTPAVGLFMDQRGVGEQTAYCMITEIIEGVPTGVTLANTLGNTFTESGTCEGCTVGLSLGAGADGNKFFARDYEANTSVDIRIEGAAKNNEFYSCDTAKFIYITAGNANHFFGGQHETIRIDSGSGNSFNDLAYNRNGTGAFSDNTSGGVTRKRGVRNGATGVYDQDKGKYSPNAVFSVSVSTGAFAYTNTTQSPVIAYVNGGTVSQVTFLRGSLELIHSSGTNTSVHLEPGDAIKIYNTVAPTLNLFPVA